MGIYNFSKEIKYNFGSGLALIDLMKQKNILSSQQENPARHPGGAPWTFSGDYKGVRAQVIVCCSDGTIKADDKNTIQTLKHLIDKEIGLKETATTK